MSGEPGGLTMHGTRRIGTGLDLLAFVGRETRTPVGMLEQDYALLSSRIDGIGTRLERIERRLDPAETPASPWRWGRVPR